MLCHTAQAMQLALNATATSALAMQLTGEALQRSATEEASELLSMLVQVCAGCRGRQGRYVGAGLNTKRVAGGRGGFWQCACNAGLRPAPGLHTLGGAWVMAAMAA